MQATISAVVLTKNEEKNIGDCLSSLSWCDEIIVIDDGSTDQTVSLAKKHKGMVFTQQMNSDYSAQRNYGLEKASGEWVLFVDADERVSLPLHYEILNTITDNLQPEYVGYYIKRFDYLWGKKLKYGETAGQLLLRLAKKDAGVWEGTVHEVWKIKGKIGKLQNVIDHYPHQSIQEFLQEINWYTTLRAEELYKKYTSVSSVQIICYPVGKFLVDYIVKRAFMDGTAGLVISLMMSFHSFLVRSKLWLLWAKSKKQSETN